MKDQARSLEYYHLVRELQPIVGARIDKVYQHGDFFLFVLYCQGERKLLAIGVPNAIYLTKHKPSFDPPKGFSQFLRRRLQGGHITKLEQLNFDRVIILRVHKDEHDYELVAEMFGKGNLMVTEAGKIVNLMRSLDTKDRIQRPKHDYIPPPAQPDLPRMSLDEFRKHFGKQEVIMVLAKELGLGGEYAELLIRRAGIKKQEIRPDVNRIYEELHNILDERKPQYLEGCAYPFRVSDKAESTNTFSEAISKVLDGKLEATADEKAVANQERKKKKLLNVVEKQEQQIKGFEKAAEENQRKGELIYKHYNELKQLLAEATNDRKKLAEEEFMKKYEKMELVDKASKQEIVVDLK